MRFSPLQHAPPLLDRHGRALHDLRLSVTDRCNFRCRYCMPREHFGGHSFLDRAELLSFEEIARVAGVFVRLGVRKLRVTGGEPLLRRQLPRLIEKLARLDVDLALTTNGVLLPQHAHSLRSAGLRRITLSLDALDEAVFQRVCDAPGVSPQDVLRGLASAEQAGFRPVKINCVVRRGQNDDQIEPLVRSLWDSGHILRFIEYMDVGTVNGWTNEEVMGQGELSQRLSRIAPLTPLPPTADGEVAQRYLLGEKLEVGIVASISTPFCGQCSRARLAADGGLYTCLFSAERHDLRRLLRAGADDAALAHEIQGLWRERSDRYSLQRGAQLSPGTRDDGRYRLRVLPRVEMSFIGG